MLLLLLWTTGCQSNPGKIEPYTGTQTRAVPSTMRASQPATPPETYRERVKREPARFGFASFYGEELRGELMANGEPFNPDQLTAASWYFPFGTRIRVVHGNHSVEVTITDRGPAHHLVRQGRIIDLSEAAFRHLADPRLGLIFVRLYPR